MSASALMRCLEIASLLGAALVSGKLWKSNLYKLYPVFFAFLLIHIPCSALPLFFKVNSSVYAYTWVIAEPTLLVLHVLIVRELFRLILSKHKGILTLGRWAMYAATFISLIISFLTLLPHITAEMPQITKYLGYVYAAQRGIDLSLVIFILLMMLFLSRYPLPLSRNIIVHASIYSVYFISCTMVVILYALFGLRAHQALDLVLTASACLCTFLWLFLLTPQGEEVHAMLPTFSPEQEQRLLCHLNSLNATLLAVSENR
jgi:hypothetical protein